MSESNDAAFWHSAVGAVPTKTLLLSEVTVIVWA